MNFSWIANIVFFGAYFIAYIVKEIPHSTWLTVSAFAALAVVIALLVFNAYPLVNNGNRNPQA